MIPLLDPEEEYETDSLEVYHPVGNNKYPTSDPDRTRSFHEIMAINAIPTHLRTSMDDEIATINEDIIRLAYDGNPEGPEDLEEFIEMNTGRLREYGREPTRDFIDSDLLAMDYRLVPLDSGPSGAEPVDINTVTVYENRNEAIDRSKDKYRNIGGLCELTIPREVISGLNPREGRASVVGIVPIEFVDKIYLSSEHKETLAQEIEAQDWDLDIETFSEDIVP